MELGLSLGEAPPAKSFAPAWKRGPAGGGELRLGFCAGFGGERETAAAEEENEERAEERGRWRPSVDPPVQLDLLPFSPITRPPSSSSSPPKLDFPWPLAANGEGSPSSPRTIEELLLSSSVLFLVPSSPPRSPPPPDLPPFSWRFLVSPQCFFIFAVLLGGRSPRVATASAAAGESFQPPFQRPPPVRRERISADLVLSRPTARR